MQTFTETYLPQFLDSEYCIVEEGRYIDPVIFQIAFLSFLRIKKINIPHILYIIDQYADGLKYFFNNMKTYNKNIYVAGSFKFNVLVGVDLKKWPGNEQTDTKAQLVSSLNVLM